MRVFQVLICLPLCLCEFNIDDTVLYKIDFPGLKPSQKDGDSAGADAPKGLFDVPELETVTMTSKNNEQYYCTIPKVVDKRLEEENAYTGLHPLGLLEKLFIQQACAYRLESYWTYELCHGKFLRQYHEERDAKNIKVQEYFLGKFDKEKYEELLAAHEKDVMEGITRHPPTKRLEQMNMPYYEVVMEDGTPCDLNGEPRRSRILYVCYPQGKNEIYSLKEVSTCEYEIVVLTSLLCSHPSYRPVESNEHSIGCRPVSEISPRKPKLLQEIETESIKLRSEKMFEAHMMGGSKPGQVKIEIKPVKIDNVDEEELAEAAKEAKSSLWKTGSSREPFKPLMDPQVVKEFLKGEYCLYGGSGWWKYEFCYGKKVNQYHEEGRDKKTVINLGNFNTLNHMNWLNEHPTKRPKEGEARKHVSHFYSEGDICDLTGKPRQIEVKLKCKKADSPSTVSLYLLEPKTCEYVLGVESPLVCDILPHADDEYGMMPEGLLDSINKEEEDFDEDNDEDEENDEDHQSGTMDELEAAYYEMEDELSKLQSGRMENRFDDDNELEDEDYEDDPQNDFEDEDYDNPDEDPVKEPELRGVGTVEEETLVITDEMLEKIKSESQEFVPVKTSQITKESVKIVDGVKTTTKQTIVDGKLVSSEETEEYLGDTFADTKEESKEAKDTKDKDEL